MKPAHKCDVVVRIGDRSWHFYPERTEHGQGGGMQRFERVDGFGWIIADDEDEDSDEVSDLAEAVARVSRVLSVLAQHRAEVSR